jgi:hypothetical protein
MAVCSTLQEKLIGSEVKINDGGGFGVARKDVGLMAACGRGGCGGSGDDEMTGGCPDSFAVYHP